MKISDSQVSLSSDYHKQHEIQERESLTQWKYIYQ